jgi:hypothetical protein
MTYPMPEIVPLYDGRTATFDHATDYTEDPRPGEDAPPSGQIYAYYRINGSERLYRVPIGTKQAKFSPSQLPAVVAALLIKVP